MLELPLMDKVTKQEIVISAYSPLLRKTITLKNEVWVYKILAMHGEVRSCRQFIQETIQNLDESSLIFKKKKDPNSIAIWKKCHFLTGMYEYIKIAIHLENTDTGVVTTAHGSNNLPTYDMEPLS